MTIGVDIEWPNERNHFGGMDPGIDAKGGKSQNFRNRSDATKQRRLNQTNARERGELVANAVEVFVVFFSRCEIV